MSAGQLVGGLVGGVVGNMLGNPIMGAQVGIMAGGWIDPPSSPNMYKPGVNDLYQQTSTYGQYKPRAYSRIATEGNVIWLENNKLRRVEIDTSKGKGAPPVSGTTAYTYYATFAVVFRKGDPSGVKFGRIWIGNRLVYDPFATDLKTIRRSNKNKKKFEFYYGTDDQEKSPTIEADMGASTPAYVGDVYMVIKNWDLTDYGNMLSGAHVKAEIYKNGTESGLTEIDSISSEYTVPAHGNTVWCPHPYYMDSKKVLWYVPNWAVDYEDDMSFSQYKTTVDSTRFIGKIPITEQFGPADVAEQPPIGTGNDKNMFWQGQEYVISSTLSGMAGIESFRHVNGWNVGLYTNSEDSNLPYIFLSESTFDNGIPADPFNEPGVATIPADDCFAVTMNSTNTLVYGVCADGIRTYDKNLSEESFWAYAFGDQSGTVTRTCLDEDDEYLWIFIGLTPSDATVYKWHVETETLTSVGTMVLPAFGGGVCEVTVENGIIVVAYFNSSSSPDTLNVKWFVESIATAAKQTLEEIVVAECLQSNFLEEADIDATDLTQEVAGYKITQISSIRAGLEPLQAAWPFDIIQSGYQIKFVARGQASVATFTSDDLGQNFQLSQSREMDSQIPKKVIIKHIQENRDYDLGEQYAERLNTDAVSVDEKALAIVLSADEAKQAAEVLLYLYWLERTEFNFILPPTARDLEPSDVITITMDYAEYELRLTSISYDANGQLNCKAKLNNAAVYTSTAVSDSGLTSNEEIENTDFDSEYLLLDIPAISDDDDTPCFKTAMYGDEDDWDGGSIIRSKDNGGNYSLVNGFASDCTVGICRNALSASPIGDSFINTFDELEVEWLAGEASSVTQLQLLNGDQYFAYGADGRWEIIGVQTITDQGDYVVFSNLLRKQFGTDHNEDNHEVGDYVVLLNDVDVQRFSENAASISIPYLYRGISAGATLESDDDRSFTYEGINLKPLKPINVVSYKNPSGDWEFYWVRQDRLGMGWRNYTDTPMSETTEEYRVRIYTDSDMDTVLREITATDENAMYTYAQTVTDGTDGDPEIYFAVYQMSSVVGYGYPSVAVSESVPAFDPYFSSVALLLHCDGTDASTTFTDSSSYGHTVTAYGNAQIDTAQSKYGGASAIFDGIGDYISPADHNILSLSSNDFTIECFARFNTLPSTGLSATLVGKGAVGTREYFFRVANVADEYFLRLTTSTDGTATAANLSDEITIVTGQFYHLAVCRYAGTVMFFVDGVMRGYSTNVSTFYSGSAAVTCGADTGGATNLFDGWLDEIRITNGVARYTENFTPPTAAFPNS